MNSLHTRRKFLRTGVLGGAAAWTLPIFIEKTFLALDALAADSAIQTATGKDSPILVIVQLAGGNDGLNTLVPFTDDAYHRARPRLGVKNPLKINDHLGLHPGLAGLHALHQGGEMAVIQGVGYPNPNRSHFRSTDIWQTASDSNKYETVGWVGRYFDSCCKGEDPTVGVAIGGQSPMAFAATSGAGISLTRPEQFRFKAENTEDPEAAEELFRDVNSEGSSVAMLAGGGELSASPDSLDFVRRTAMDAQVSSDKILEVSRKSTSPVTYPGSRLANDLRLVARLIAGGMATRVYYVSQGGYDTHSGQDGAQQRLLAELDASLAAFVADLKAQGNFGRVLMMSFSEFGRRVAENQSGGTDHGTAAPMFVVGGAIKPGLHGSAPSLTSLDHGDIIHTVDFRSVYATVLDNWLQAPSETVLNRKFPLLGFV